MPNTKSAKKALRSSLKKREYNLTTKYRIKNSLKDLRKVIAIDPANYQTALDKAYSTLDKAVKSNFIHRNKADRKKSRLALNVAKILANPTTKVEEVNVEMEKSKITKASKVVKTKVKTK
jgi:small subunit ribosomal protein S20